MNPSETFIIIDYFIALFLRLLLRFFQDWLLNFANRIPGESLHEDKKMDRCIPVTFERKFFHSKQTWTSSFHG